VALDPVVALEQTRQDVAHLSQGELLADADARATVEWDVLPRLGLPREPAVRAEGLDVGELFGHGRVQVGAALHHEGAVADGGVLEDGDGLGAVGAAAAGEGCVFQGHADAEKGGGGVSMHGMVW